MDLSGLPEAAVDSEEEEEEDEDLERASDALLGRDLVRECLEKEPADRNDDDIGQCSNSSCSCSHVVSNLSLLRAKLLGSYLKKYECMFISHIFCKN